MDSKAFRNGAQLQKLGCPIRLRFHACFKEYIICSSRDCAGASSNLCQLALSDSQVRHIERAIILQLKNVMMELMFAHFSVNDRFLGLRKKYKKYRRQKSINDKSIENIMRALLYTDLNEVELSNVLKFFENEETFLKRKIELTLSKMHIYQNIDSLYKKFTLQFIKDINCQNISKIKIDSENMVRNAFKEKIYSIVISKSHASMCENFIKDNTYIKNSIVYDKMLDNCFKLNFHICIKFIDGSSSERLT